MVDTPSLYSYLHFYKNKICTQNFPREVSGEVEFWTAQGPTVYGGIRGGQVSSTVGWLFFNA